MTKTFQPDQSFFKKNSSFLRKNQLSFSNFLQEEKGMVLLVSNKPLRLQRTPLSQKKSNVTNNSNSETRGKDVLATGLGSPHP